MPARLQGAVKNFVGLSGDIKPLYTDEANLTPLGVNSTFFEKDTWRVWVWDGTLWSAEPQASLASGLNAAMVGILSEVLEVLGDIRDEARASRLGIQTYISAGDAVQDDLLDLSLEIRDQKNEE